MTDHPTPELNDSQDKQPRSNHKYLLLFVAILAFIFLSVAVAAIWFFSKERDVTALTNRILSNAGTQQINITAKRSVISWRGLSKASVVTLEDVHATMHDKDIVHAPFAYASLDLLSLITGNVSIDHLEIHEATIQVPEQFLAFDASSKSTASALPFKKLSLYNASANIHYKDHAYALPINELEVQQQNTQTILKIDTSGQWHGEQTSLQADITHDTESGLSIDSRFSGINPGNACHLILNCYEMPQLDMPLSGEVSATLDTKLTPLDVNFSIQGGAGHFRYQDYYPAPIAFDTAAIDGTYNAKDETLALSRFEFAMQEQTKVMGKLNLQGTSIDKFTLTLDGQAANMPADHLDYYWPHGLSPMSREWATTKIRDGMAEKATLNLTLTQDDMKHELLPDEVLKAVVHVNDATVEYLDSLPPAKKAKGIIHFTGATMRADIKSARIMKAGALKSADVHFTDLNADGTPVEIALDLSAPASDVLDFLSHASFNPLPRLPLSYPSPSGEMSAQITLAFDAFSGNTSGDVNWDAVQYSIDASLKNISGIKAKNIASLNDVNGSFALKNNTYKGDLKAYLSSAPAALSFDVNEKTGESYTLNATLTPGLLSAVAPSSMSYINGPAAIDAKIKRRNGAITAMNAQLNLTPAELTIREANWFKPAGTTASLSINREKRGRYNLNFNSADTTFQAYLNGELQPFHAESFEVTRLQSPGNDVAIFWQPLASGNAIDIRGRQLDLSGFMAGGEGGLSDFPRIRLSTNIEKVKGANEEFLNNVKGHLHCETGRCLSADIRANLGNGTLHTTIGAPNGTRQFTLDAKPAAPLLKWLDFSDRLERGTLDIDGSYDDTKASAPFKGRLRLMDFTLRDAPIFGRILNLASFKGLVETLSTTGITFEAFKGDIFLHDDLVNIEDMHASSSSIGILGKAQANLKNDMVDIRGNLVPAYSINSLLSKVPVLGELLAGGEGSGIVGFDFRVQGNTDNPSVVVNPLSAFTPGFTRKFFDLFSSPLDTDKNATTPDSLPSPN